MLHLLLNLVFLPLVLLGTPTTTTTTPVETPVETPVPTPGFTLDLPTGCADQPTLALAWSDNTNDDYIVCEAESLVDLTIWSDGELVQYFVDLVYEDGSVNLLVQISLEHVDMGQPEWFVVGYCAAPQMGCTPDLPWFPNPGD